MATISGLGTTLRPDTVKRGIIAIINSIIGFDPTDALPRNTEISLAELITDRMYLKTGSSFMAYPMSSYSFLDRFFLELSNNNKAYNYKVFDEDSFITNMFRFLEDTRIELINIQIQHPNSKGLNKVIDSLNSHIDFLKNYLITSDYGGSAFGPHKNVESFHDLISVLFSYFHFVDNARVDGNLFNFV